MGSGASRRSSCFGQKEQGDLWLPSSNLRFSPEQLQRLNAHLSALLDPAEEPDPGRDRAQAAVHAVVERLVQRLVCAVGTLDPRFSCKFLAALDPRGGGGQQQHQPHPHRHRALRYLVRLDNLSAPPLYPDDCRPTCRVVECLPGADVGVPQGFAKLRVQGEGADRWAEFINQSGFLRRDKIQERFVELLAQAAARATSPSGPDQVDESVLCGCPGKVVDVGILQQILSMPAEEHVFYGADWSQARFPDPRDFRIAIVEGSPEVRLRVGLLSPALRGDVEAKLVLGVGSPGWPAGCDFPGRVPLAHVDCLLFHTAAQTGFYAMPAAPHPTSRCDDRAAAWQIRLPAAEACLLTHHAASSAPARVLAAAEAVVAHLKGRRGAGIGLPPPHHHEQLRVLGGHLLRTLLWLQLEQTPQEGGPADALLAWTQDALSGLVLQLLDATVGALRTQRCRCYFFPRRNAALAAAGLGEEDYARDAALLRRFLARLHDASAGPRAPGQEPDPPGGGSGGGDHLERVLLQRWRSVVAGLAPVTRLPKVPRYSDRQIDYINLLLGEVMRVRELTLQDGWPSLPTAGRDDCRGDLAFLLEAVLEQAKEQAFGGGGGPARGGRGKARQGAARTRAAFEAASRRLVDTARRSGQAPASDKELVAALLQWLHRGAEEDAQLGAALRPYLDALHRASREAAWHLEEWRRRRQGALAETRALAAFCRAVAGTRGATPAPLLVDAAAKGWRWAEALLEELGGGGGGAVRLVLAPERGVTLRHVLGLPAWGRCPEASSVAGTLRARRATLNRAAATLPALLQRSGHTLHEAESSAATTAPAHCRLRDASPLTATLDASRRYGQHRGMGDVVQALVVLRKFTVLQDISAHLPDGERRQMLDAIQKVSRDSRRSAASRRAALKQRAAQSYRPRCELDRAPPPEAEVGREPAGLLEACRAAARSRSQQLQQQPLAAFNGAAFLQHGDLPDVGLLRLTDDHQLRLVGSGEVVQTIRRGEGAPHRRRDIVTKL